MSVDIRPARPDEADHVLALLGALWAEMEVQDPRFRIAPDALDRMRRVLPERLRAWGFGVMVAVADETCVGVQTVTFFEAVPLYTTDPAIVLMETYVQPEFRGLGVGRALVDAALQWGAERGAVQARVGVLAQASTSRTFWERAGAQALEVHYTLPIPHKPARKEKPRIGFL